MKAELTEERQGPQKLVGEWEYECGARARPGHGSRNYFSIRKLSRIQFLTNAPTAHRPPDGSKSAPPSR